MRDLLLQVKFLVHVELHDTDSFPESDVQIMLDRIQKSIEQDSRCTMIIEKQFGGLMPRILYQERRNDGCT